MAIIITVNQKGARLDTVEKLVRELLKDKYPEASVSVVRKDPPESRSDRFNEAIGMVSDGKSEIEGLRDELQEWRDGLPENLQGGDKASELDEAISSLDDILSSLEEAEGADVEFPGMY